MLEHRQCGMTNVPRCCLASGRDEHLTDNVEHMKISLYLTDVVVLRNNGDTVNILGLELTREKQGLRGEKQYRARGIPIQALPSTRSTVMEFATANPLDRHDYSNFRTAVGKLIFMAPWRADVQVAAQSLNWKQSYSATVDAMFQSHALEPHESCQTG